MKNIILITMLFLTIPLIAHSQSQFIKKIIIPEDVKKVQVDSWTKDGVKLFSYDLDVEPGQVFEVKPK